MGTSGAAFVLAPPCGFESAEKAGVHSVRSLGGRLPITKGPEREEAIRGFTIHAIVYAVVMTGLIILNLTVATEFPWAVFPLVCWGIGLTMHYLFGLRWVGKVITDRQAKVEQRAAATKRAA
jgi:2TM domain